MSSTGSSVSHGGMQYARDLLVSTVLREEDKDKDIVTSLEKEKGQKLEEENYQRRNPNTDVDEG